MFGKKGAHLERPFKFLRIDGAFLVQIANGLAHIAFVEMLVKVWEPVQSLAVGAKSAASGALRRCQSPPCHKARLRLAAHPDPHFCPSRPDYEQVLMMERARPACQAADYGLQASFFALGRLALMPLAGWLLDGAGSAALVAALAVASAGMAALAGRWMGALARGLAHRNKERIKAL